MNGLAFVVGNANYVGEHNKPHFRNSFILS